MNQERIELLNNLIKHSIFENDAEIINSLDISDIDYIIQKVYNNYPSDLNTYQTLYEKYDDEYYNKKSLKWMKLLTTEILHLICEHLINYDLFKYLFDYLFNNKRYVLTLNHKDIGNPFDYVCNNYNYDIFELYLNHVIIYDLESLSPNLFHNLNIFNFQILKKQLDTIVEYNLNISCDAADFDRTERYFESLDDNELEYFISSLMQLPNPEETYRSFKFVNEELRNYPEKQNYIQTILDNIMREIEQPTIKSVEYLRFIFYHIFFF